MLENVLTARGVSLRLKITIKTAVSVALVLLSALLPMFVHLVAGSLGGAKWLPMYLPVLIGGCLLGSVWGLGIAVVSPLFSFFVTSAIGSPMPALARLPFMMAELVVFACVAGLFSEKIAENRLFAFPAVLLAQLAGRGSFLDLVWLFESVSPLSFSTALMQVQAGLAGLYLQAVVAPLVIIVLGALLKSNRK